MKRHTLESVTATIDALTQQDTVYKVDVDAAKDELSRAYDNARNEYGKHFTHAGQWQNLTEEERAVDLPYEVRHLFGKKFSTTLVNAPDTNAMNVIRNIQEGFRPVYLKLQALIERQVKGRKPVERAKRVVGTRTQLRAICPCCFKQHAVKNDRLVAHGYTLYYGFQNGTCSGAGKKHFGTEAGRDEAARMAENARSQGEAMLQTSEDVLANPAKYTIRDYRARPIENPNAGHIKEHAQRIAHNGEGLIRYADEVANRVENWKPEDTVEVEVEVTA